MKMKTLEALKGSIKKWEKIHDGTGMDEGRDNCALCQRFQNEDCDCDGCPVEVRTGLEVAKKPHTRIGWITCARFTTLSLAVIESNQDAKSARSLRRPSWILEVVATGGEMTAAEKGEA